MGLLQQLDKKLWSQKALKLVGSERLPLARREKIAWGTGVLMYRSVYYMSDSNKYPYVRFGKYLKHNVPVVSCCTEDEFIDFLRSYDDSLFHNVHITIPIEIMALTCDL